MSRHILIINIALLAGSLLYALPLHAQSGCDKALIEAENLYQSGQLYDISEKLLQCIDTGFDKQQKQSAYRLLALTYLNINQEEKAKNALHRLLLLNPDYAIDKAKDPIELYNLYTQFNVNPVFYAGIRGGVLVSQPLVLHQRSASSIEGGTDKYYRPGYGYELGLELALPLRPWLLLELTPAYTNSSYQFEFNYHTDAFSERPVVQKVEGSEVYHQLLVPLSLSLRIPHGKATKPNLLYTVTAGVGTSYLLASSFQDVRRLNQQIFSEEIIEGEVETSGYRRTLNFQGQFALGLEYKYQGLIWGARLGTSSMLLNNTRYPSQQELYLNAMSTSFGWIDDDRLMLSAQFSVFVRKPLYKLL